MKYAAYGSNLHPVRLTERIPSARFLGTEYVPDWSLRFHKRGNDTSAKCSISRDGPGIHVAVFDISADDRAILDRIEGVGSGYATATLRVGAMGDCMTYVAEAHYIDNALAPFDWYKELVIVGAVAHKFPVQYIQELEAVEAQPDDNLQRARDARRIIKLAKAAAIF
jgi:hypothetical protein